MPAGAAAVDPRAVASRRAFLKGVSFLFAPKAAPSSPSPLLKDLLPCASPDDDLTQVSLSSPPPATSRPAWRQTADRSTRCHLGASGARGGCCSGRAFLGANTVQVELSSGRVLIRALPVTEAV